VSVFGFYKFAHFCFRCRFDEEYELASRKLAGAQQFQRLQLELRHVISMIDFDVVLPPADYPDPPGNVVSVCDDVFLLFFFFFFFFFLH
jgi:hypothetical protein